jgi:hypothetical protein
MWVLKYTTGCFWLYFTVKIVVNTTYAFIVFPWFARRGVVDFNASLITFILASIVTIIGYVFQMWQEGRFAPSKKTDFSPTLQPAVAKPIPKEQEDKENHE